MKENNTANTNTSSTTTMTLDKALEICRQRVSIDRRMRENIPVEKFNDYDKFCENECIAIETLINALQCRKALDNLKEGFYNPKEHKPFAINNFNKDVDGNSLIYSAVTTSRDYENHKEVEITMDSIVERLKDLHKD